MLLVGAGAIGGLYAVYLAAGADVTVLDLNAAHVEAIRRDGLVLAGRTERVQRLEAFTAAADLGRRRLDAVILLVKCQVEGDRGRVSLDRAIHRGQAAAGHVSERHGQ